MPDDKTKTHPLDAKRINIHEDYEVRDWCRILGVTADQLRNAVQQVGTSGQAIRKYFGQ